LHRKTACVQFCGFLRRLNLLQVSPPGTLEDQTDKYSKMKILLFSEIDISHF